jgi:hypothetical protein
MPTTEGKHGSRPVKECCIHQIKKTAGTAISLTHKLSIAQFRQKYKEEVMYQVPDPAWKVCPDIVADESYEEIYSDEEDNND